ncbi:AzlC family ABC transporter permease [Pusillimonas sp.]|uniref:AzlC family ABC transporter permease n=1 Tax=Pusillimonas sp. TaxID=3040095 RepID=UPI0039C9307C
MAHSRSSISWPDARARRSFAAGFNEAASAMVALCIWAFVTGFAMVSYGLTEGMAVLMSLLVYAGSAQLTALPLIMAGAPLWLIFAAGFVVNIRFIIFGAALQPYFRKYSWLQRLGLGYWLSDLVFVFFMTRYGDARRKGTRGQLWYYLGIIVPGWFAWQTFSLLGIFAGAFVPPSWSLEFAATLALMGLAIPLVKNTPMMLTVLVTGAVAWVGQALPLRLGLVVAIVAGVAAGVLAELARKKKKERTA